MANLERIPDELIRALRYLSMSKSHTTSPYARKELNWYDSPDTRAAYEMIHKIPSFPETGDEESIQSAVLSLVNEFSEENVEFIKNNPAFLRAFPILKEIYDIGPTPSDKEKQNAISDFSSMFGKENVPEHLRVSDKMTEIKQEISSLWPEGTGPDVGDMEYDPPESAPGARGTLREDTSVETLGDAGLVPKYKSDEPDKPVQELSGRFPKAAFSKEQDLTYPMRPKTDDSAYMEGERITQEENKPPETDSESGRDAYTIEKDVAITEALEAGDYEKVKSIEEAYKNKKPIPTKWTDDWSYMGTARGRHQEGGLVGYANGGELPVGGDELPVGEDEQQLMDAQMGFVGTPEEGAIDQEIAAQNGEMGGDKVDKNLPEGSYVLNSYAVELAGIKDIEKLIKDAQRFYSDIQETEGIVQQPIEGDVEVRVSEGEYIIPPALVKIIGRDRLEKINKRGIEEFNRQQTAETEEGGMLEGPQESEGFMSPEGGAPMLPEDAAPISPEQVPQGFAGGGMAQGDVDVPLYKTLGYLQNIFGPKPQQSAPKRVAQATKPKAGPQTGGQRIGGQRIGGQPPSPLARVNPFAPGAQNLQKPNVRVANMGGFVPYSRHG